MTNERYYELIKPYEDASRVLSTRLEILNHSLYGDRSDAGPCLLYTSPGDPARQVAGPQATKEDVELVREQLGLNKPLPQQYISYVTGLVKGDLGTSLRTKRPVLTEVQGRYMNTVQLTLLSLTWSVIAGVLIGVWSGRN